VLSYLSLCLLPQCKNSFGKTICVPKTASAGERPVSSLGCALSPRSTKGNSSDHVAVAAHARSASLRRRCNQAGLVLRPAGLFAFFFSGNATRQSRNRIPTRRGDFCTPRNGGASTASTDTLPVPSTGTAPEVGPLTSSSPSRG
jgi:hypothetical protein